MADIYGAPLVPLLKIFLSDGHHIVIWWPPDNYLVAKNIFSSGTSGAP